MSFISAREHGAKVGSAGVASDQHQGIERRERLRKLALETIDLAKDPYFMRNHLGQYECRLCLTLHTNEGNYLAHTQGKRHQQNLAKRAAREAKEKVIQPAPKTTVTPRKTVKIGKPGYRITKLYDPDARQRHLLFQIDYPEIQDAERPRHRFMSAFEQKKEAADRGWQYILFAAEPYEVIAFKVPSHEVDKTDEKFFAVWDEDARVYSLNVAFKNPAAQAAGAQAMNGSFPNAPGLPRPPVPPVPPGHFGAPGAGPRPPMGIPRPPMPPIPPSMRAPFPPNSIPRPPSAPLGPPRAPLPPVPPGQGIPRPPAPPPAGTPPVAPPPVT